MFSLKFQEKIRAPVTLFARLMHRTGLARIWWALANFHRFLLWTSPSFKKLNPKLVLDVGANTGEFLEVMLKVFPETKVIAFEPQKACLGALNSRYAANPRVRIFPVGLGDARSESDLHIAPFNPSSSFYPIEGSLATEQVTIKRLDDFESEIQWEKPALLKIDVEGYELAVLRGAEKCLHRLDTIYVEARASRPIGCRFDEIYRFLTDRGWIYRGAYDSVFTGEGELQHFDCLFVKAPGA